MFNTSTVTWTAEAGSNYQILDTEIPVPMTDGCYSIIVLFENTKQTTGITPSLQVYDVLEFNSFKIPIVSYTKEDNTVVAEIKGKNFDTPGTNLADFYAVCSSKTSIVSNTKFKKINDSVINATFTIPGTVGEYEISIFYGSNSIKQNLKVKDFSEYSVGDVLLNDGTIVKYNANSINFTIEQRQKAVGILYFDEYDSPRGWLGFYNSGNRQGCKWSIESENSIFLEDIACTPSQIETNAADTATFIGDTDVSDNWAYICYVSPVATSETDLNYPAFDYVKKYASTAGLKGDYADNWYMPSVAELCYIHRNKTVLNSVIIALGGNQLSGAYWSSSQSISDKTIKVLTIGFEDNAFNGYVGETIKSYHSNVCCVRPFNYE